jgi:hypothetical protein
MRLKGFVGCAVVLVFVYSPLFVLRVGAGGIPTLPSIGTCIEPLIGSKYADKCAVSSPLPQSFRGWSMVLLDEVLDEPRVSAVDYLVY